MSNSIGDLKNSGLQGNNWPWQYKVLLGLDKIVAAIGGTEYEAQIIKATCPGPTPASGYYLEVRIYNTSTGTFGAPVYYLPGSTTPVNLSACTKEYANDNTVLTQIYNELVDQGVTLDAIETAVEGTLTVQATDLDIRTLTCDDTVSLCFDNAGTPTQVSDTNPLPVNATVTIPNPLPVSQDSGSNPWIVDATDLDIRNLDFTTDSVDVSGSNVNAVVTATDLDIRDLDFTTDSVDVTGSDVTVSNTVTVQATALDIRPLDCGTDSIKICDGQGNDLVINGAGGPSDGSINSVLVDLTTGNPATINPDGTQNNLIYAFDPNTSQPEALTSTDISGIQALDVNVAGGTVGVTQSTSPWVVSPAAGVQRLPFITRVTGGGTIAPGARSFSIFNAGSAPGSILGGVNNLLPGEEVDFVAGGNDSFGLITFNGNGVTTLVVTYVS